ncbi:unnamed protein product [Rotaria sp. Silwood1]|nr:unnamed protein product [Rotaria sp. Silwood1]CAF1581374.1 unnamed protein product [Rotaria sp. Silwood1]
MATTSNTNLPTVDHNVNTVVSDDQKTKHEDEARKSPLSSIDNEQGGKTTKKVDDLNSTVHADKLSSVESSHQGMKTNIISLISNNLLDINIDKKNEGNTVGTTQHKEESKSTPVSSTSTTTNTTKTTVKTPSSSPTPDKDNKKVETITTTTVTSTSNKDHDIHDHSNFTIGKGDSKHLTDFQRQKAKYFFHVNLDIENKEFVTWKDVEFYLLFHVTAARKEGSGGGDLEARLSRATRAFWEHIHDQIPLVDGKRDTLTLDQFLDTWASLVDYVVRTNQLPPIVHDLVKLGFELYSTDDYNGVSSTIQPSAFDQLFQNMNLSRTHAIMAYQFLTENGTKPLDADKIESIVKAVITSSDVEHDSHFLLPGFFKVIASRKDNVKEKTNQSSSPVPDKDQSEVHDVSSSKSTSQTQQPTTSSSTQSQPTQKTSSTTVQAQNPSEPFSQNQVNNGSTLDSLNIQQQNIYPSSETLPPRVVIQNEDDNIRQLLRFYHIDDGDTVEVADGSVPRVVFVHPERPLPPYVQQNPQVYQNLQRDPTNIIVQPQAGLNVLPNLMQNNTKPFQQTTTTTTTTETKPKVTLEERLSRGETQQGPTIPIRPDQQQGGNTSTTRIRQVYPHISEIQQEEQLKQAKLQANQNLINEKKPKEETSIINDVSSNKQDKIKEKKEITREDEEKLVATILQRLTPIVEKRVSEELHRIHSGENDQDDNLEFIPFPFMFTTGAVPFFVPPRGGPPPQAFRPPPSPTGQQQQQQQQSFQQNRADPRQQQQQQPKQQQANLPREAEYIGLPPGAAFLPPPIIMAMMSDLARGGMAGEIPVFPPNMPPPPHGPGGMPAGLEGFMMFVDDEPMMDLPPGFPLRPEPRF